MNQPFASKKKLAQSGFGLIEIVIVTAITAIALFAFSQAEILAVKLLRNERENLEASLLAQEAMEAVRSVRDESWTNNIAPLANGLNYYPTVVNSKWQLSTIAPPLINGKYMRYIFFDAVTRDAQDKIASSGTLDTGTRKITSRTAWTKGETTSTVELVNYITNFQEPLNGPKESKVISFEDAPTDSNLASFPSDNAGSGDPSQSFTTLTSAIKITKVELYMKRTTSTPSDIYAELRLNPTGIILGTSNIINSSTVLNTGLTWVEFRFSNPVALAALTKYYIRLRSMPSSTDASSGSAGNLNWGYRQTATSPYLGGEAIRYIGKLSNPNDAGTILDQYDFGFKVYALQ